MEKYVYTPKTEIIGIEQVWPGRFKLYLRNVEFAWATNFAGVKSDFNRSGNPNCSVILRPEDAERLANEYGFKIYESDPVSKNPELSPQDYPVKLITTFKLSMDSDLIREGRIPMPTVVSMIQGKEDTTRIFYDANTVKALDGLDVIDATITVDCSLANPEKGQKWTQCYISQLGVILADRITFFEQQFGLFN